MSSESGLYKVTAYGLFVRREGLLVRGDERKSEFGGGLVFPWKMKQGVGYQIEGRRGK